MMLGPYEYIIESITGEYAYMKRTDIYDSGEPFMIALALLPEGSSVGSRIHWENMEYSLL